MYQLVALIVGWLLVAVLSVSLYKTDSAATARNARTGEALQQCRGTLDGLNTRVRAIEIETKAASAAADVYAKGLHKRADVQLSTPATRPGNDCASAADRAQLWLKMEGGEQ